MSVTYGFYNSLNGDRKYDATQLSSLFDGLIIDGVFASIGTCFVVKAATGNTVNVGIGKAWFNKTWTLNDAILPLEAPISEVLLDRIDAVVIEVDTSERVNSIKFVEGVPSSSPVNPTLASGPTLFQYPLCYIYRAAESTEITQADITNMVGTEETPFITGILQTISLDELLGQWEDELDQFVASEQADFTNWMTGWMNDVKDEYDDWFNQMKTDLLAEKALLDQWIASEQADFLAWLDQMKDQLGSDLSKVEESIDYGGVIRSITSDDNYLYVGGQTTKKVYKLNKSNLNKVSESIDYGGTIYSIASDDDYLYVGGGTTQKVYKLNKSDLSKVSESIDYGGTIRSITSDDDYLYVGGQTTRKVYKLNKSNLNKVSESINYGGNIYSIASDDDYLYVGGGTTQKVYKLIKLDAVGTLVGLINDNKEESDTKFGLIDSRLADVDSRLADHVRIELSESTPSNPGTNTWWYEDLGETPDLGGGDGGLLLGNASTEEGDDIWFDEV